MKFVIDFAAVYPIYRKIHGLALFVDCVQTFLQWKEMCKKTAVKLLFMDHTVCVSYTMNKRWENPTKYQS